MVFSNSSFGNVFPLHIIAQSLNTVNRFDSVILSHRSSVYFFSCAKAKCISLAASLLAQLHCNTSFTLKFVTENLVNSQAFSPIFSRISFNKLKSFLITKEKL